MRRWLVDWSPIIAVACIVLDALFIVGMIAWGLSYQR